MAAFKNNGKLKLLIIVGTRPEIIRLAAVINKCRQYFDCLLAHTSYDGVEQDTLIAEGAVGVVANGVAQVVTVASGVREIVLAVILVHP